MNYTSAINDIESIYKKHFDNYSFKTFDFCITMPPPNVTGNLHIGHALNLFVQDMMVRQLKFHGTSVRWIPGTDHSGIATQLLVKKKLAEQGIKDISSADLLKSIWEWKDIYEDAICKQLKYMGTLLDWNSYKFTLEEDINKKVYEAFYRLNGLGLIFRDKRIVNWDIALQTVISDIEVLNKEVNGTLWYIKYFTEDGDYIEVATTRPETLFADEAVAIHPDNEKYKQFIGKKVIVPIINKLVPIISDKKCEIDKGSGCVKIDPAHALLDFEIGKDHKLPIRQVIDKHGKMCGDVPDWIMGVDRFEAKKLVVKKLKEANLITKEEQIKQLVPHGQRSDSILEPLVTEQWFFDMPKLAKRSMEIVDTEEVKIIPEHFKNLFRRYMENIQPWCISRQLVWGHRIPAWHTPDGRIIIARNTEEAIQISGCEVLEQDNDVLDTWFSSALWPFATLEWPNKMDPKFYPNIFLVTGSDILFFWVSKMIMMGIALTDSVPFKEVYLHGLIQDESGSKMSKSKGNVIDPLNLCKEEGIDVVRFALLSASTAGRNIKFGSQNIDKSRKFLIKIWNAMNFCLEHHGKDVFNIKHSANSWIINETNKLEVKIDKLLKDWNIYEASNEIYSFFWNEFCSSYVETIKYLLTTDCEQETKYTIHYCCTKIIKMMHPFLPFVTEYFWNKFTGKENILESYFSLDINFTNTNHFNRILAITSNIRSITKNFNFDRGESISIESDLSQDDLLIITALTKYSFDSNQQKQDYLKFPFEGVVIYLNRESCKIDDIKLNFDKIISLYTQEIDLLTNKLHDQGFVKHAHPEEVESIKTRLAQIKQDVEIYHTSSK